jgi:hypothetical protein
VPIVAQHAILTALDNALEGIAETINGPDRIGAERRIFPDPVTPCGRKML